ncbi:MAG: restriction endonuclease [Chloroflexota bacterium]|nr:restriction endonuclease [Chloroflexota bacterium]
MFREGGYASVGFDLTADLSEMTSIRDIEQVWREAHPNSRRKTNAVDQTHCFLNEIAPGDQVITPAPEGKLYVGAVQGGDHEGKFYCAQPGPSDAHRNRRLVAYRPDFIFREEFPVPMRYSLMAHMTVFNIDEHFESFASVVGQPMPADSPGPRTLIRRLLELDALDTERLVAALLKAMGCTSVRRTGKTGDGGVDIRARLNAQGLAEVELFVQVKRYRPTGIIAGSMVQQLRSAIPVGGHGLFVTTSAFSREAAKVSMQAGFPRIELIDGAQLEQLVAVHAGSLPRDLRRVLELGTDPG